MTLRALGLALCLIARADGAVAAPLQSSPRPAPRPVTLERTVLPATGVISSLRPRPRPASLTPYADIVVVFAATATTPRPQPRPNQLPDSGPEAVAAKPVPDAPTEKGTICGNPAITGQSIAPIAAKLKGCGLEDGVKVTSVAGVTLSEPALIDCATANALAQWVQGAVIPGIGKKGGGVAQLQIAASYVCRPRNNRGGGKVSEHGRGRAVDIAAILLHNGTVITVLDGWGSSRYGKLLKKLRKSACGPFSTVLGPGSDRFHGDHLHLDTARGRGDYCR